jgi:hypothetical protein
MRPRRLTRPVITVAAALAVALAAALGGAPSGYAGAPTAAAPAYRIICHPGNPTTVVERSFVEDAFLKKVRAWPGGEALRPVDQTPESPVRRRFSEEVLRRPVDAVRAYWQQHIFSGRDVPPPELDSDEDVVRYVARGRGAVGYVSASATLEGVKVLMVR